MKKKITILLILIIVIMLFNTSFEVKGNLKKDFYSNYYKEKYILNNKIKIILNNHVIFLLLYLKNLETNSYIVENRNFEQLFNNYSKKFNFSYNSKKFLNEVVSEYNLETLKVLSMINLSLYINIKNMSPNITPKIENNNINQIQKEVDIFISNNNQLYDDFIEKLFNIIEDEFQKYIKFIYEDDVSYFLDFSGKTTYCVDFYISNNAIGGLASPSEYYNSFILINLKDNIYANYYVFIHENVHVLYNMNKFADQIYKLCEKNSLFFDIESLLQKDGNDNLYYNYRGSKEILNSKEDFFSYFIYKVFNEFYAHTFSSFLLKIKHDIPTDILYQSLFIREEKINNDQNLKNIYDLQTFLINDNRSIYFQFLNEPPSIEKIYKLFLLFLYSHFYNLDELLQKVLY